MTPSEEIIARYARIERETDAFGRVIGVKKLKISQRIKIEEMTPNLDGEASGTDDKGNPITIPRRAIPLLAASVVEIDGTPLPFVKTRGELDSLIDNLGEEGIAAVGRAWARLDPPARGADEKPEGVIEQAKK